MLNYVCFVSHLILCNVVSNKKENINQFLMKSFIQPPVVKNDDFFISTNIPQFNTSVMRTFPINLHEDYAILS